MSSARKDGDKYIFESEDVIVTVEPSLGGKISSIKAKKTGFELLFRDTRTTFDGAKGYSMHDISGQDECFPTVNDCVYPEGALKGVPLGDHGLLWDHPWTAELRDDCLIASCELPQLNCRFERSSWMDTATSFYSEYTISNHGPEPLKYLYAGHALMRGTPDTFFDWPDGVKEIYYSYLDKRPGLKLFGTALWPESEAEAVPKPMDASSKRVTKFFTDKLKKGWSRICYPNTGDALKIEFDTASLPYLAVLVQEGCDAAVSEYFQNELLLALEPSSGQGDDLAMCESTNSLSEIPSGSAVRFWIRYTHEPI